MKKLLAVIMLLNPVLTVAGEIRLVSEETENLKSLLDVCDEALYACDQKQKTQAEVIEIQDQFINGQATRIGELESSRSAIINNKFVWFIGGLIIGGVAFSLAK